MRYGSRRHRLHIIMTYHRRVWVARATVLAAAAVAVTRVGAQHPDAVVSLVSTSPIGGTEATFASWNIDPSCNRGFHFTAFDNVNLVAAATGLHPSRLRFGGSGADNLVYGLTPGSPECASVTPVGCDYVTPGCLNASHWDGVFALANSSGTDFIFGVSFGLADACAKGPVYAWNATNIGVLLAYLRAHGQRVWGFELGNEINNCGGPPCNLTAAQQAAALTAFAAVLAAGAPGAVLIGPDSGGRAPETWLRALLPLVPPGVLHAVTHHVYNGITRANFNVPAQLDSSLSEIAWYTRTLAALAPGAQVWAGENGPTGGGDDGTCGTGSACGTFATTLWYADDMALRAKLGFVQYQRQDLFGGAYGLVGSPDGREALRPSDAVVIHPDYWVAFLWKRCVGSVVLNATSSAPHVRAYAFLGQPSSPFAAAQCGGSSGGSGLQLLLLNLGNTSAAVELPLGGATDASFAAWSLAPASDGDAFGIGATLNGAALPVVINTTAVDPRTFLQRITQPAAGGKVSDGIVLPRLSTTFVCYDGM